MSLDKETFVQQYVLKVIQNGRNMPWASDGMLDTAVNEGIKAYDKIKKACK
ncbi:hypothetical protein PP940_gp154 [Rhizobium phage RL2RES]|uniref:Uncharacterized protein n=1 Tax=Rhizobium phage RL2RES TaxID=103371 RepID=A0A6B9J268_9CAUD|nr:hypothetical protein PP940_gp154 [Rhizobium phage RL2RES]QGZ14360.1 hypothetical protein RL2RES_154 [Rhizobium phage RL2RES]